MERRAFVKSAFFGALASGLPRIANASVSGTWHEHVRPLMGTYVNIAVFAESAVTAEVVSADCFRYLEAQIALISNWDQGSLTSLLNESRGIKRLPGNSILQKLVRDAISVRTATGGNFDPNILALTTLWREAKAAHSIPSRLEVREALHSVRNSELCLSDSQLEMHGDSGVEFDGIGKGLIADIAAEFLKNNGVRFGRVACSGDIRFFGPTTWTVDLEHPREERILGSLQLFGDVAVASSGDYRNCWSVNGRTYHHLIDPQSGYPGARACQATVIAPTCALADALAVGAFFMGGGAVTKLPHPALGSVVVASDGALYLGQGVKISRNFALTRG